MARLGQPSLCTQGLAACAPHTPTLVRGTGGMAQAGFLIMGKNIYIIISLLLGTGGRSKPMTGSPEALCYPGCPVARSWAALRTVVAGARSSLPWVGLGETAPPPWPCLGRGTLTPGLERTPPPRKPLKVTGRVGERGKMTHAPSPSPRE